MRGNYEKKLKSYLNANGIESSIFNLALTENKEYKIGGHVYYNPVSNTSCNYKNYWTTANQNCTRYI